MCFLLLHCFILILLVNTSFSFSINRFNLKNIDLVTKPYKFKINNSKLPLLFLTGASNIMPDYIYSNFIEKLRLNNFDVKWINEWDISDKFDSIAIGDTLNIIGHSSCVKLIVKLCNKYSNIKNIIFLDPVDNRFSLSSIYRSLFNKFNPIVLKNVRNILIIKAEKSYKFSKKPLNLPFIPVFGLNENNFKLNKKMNVNVITIKDFGHADILDKNWSDFMHYNKICTGNNNRDETYLNLYHTSVSNIIYKFVENIKPIWN